MDVAILGASGDCGREIAVQLVAARLLAPTERLQLVGRAEGPSARVLHGLVSDLTDAHAEFVPDLDVVTQPEDIVADLWIVAAGHTPPTAAEGRAVSRADLGRDNAVIFSRYAEALAAHGSGSELVIAVANPVELAVEIFAEAVGRARVIGIGAYSDTLRFRREIAADLGLRRQRVTGFMLGEHGENQLPVWSSVAIHGLDDTERAATVTRLRRGHDLASFAALVERERTALAGLLAEGAVATAFERLATLPPDARVILKPIVTHLSGAKTVMATAHATIDLVRALLEGHELLLAAQVQLAGDFYGLSGPLGVPAIVGPAGVRRVVELPLAPEEVTAIRAIAARVQARVAQWRLPAAAVPPPP